MRSLSSGYYLQICFISHCKYITMQSRWQKYPINSHKTMKSDRNGDQYLSMKKEKDNSFDYSTSQEMDPKQMIKSQTNRNSKAFCIRMVPLPRLRHKISPDRRSDLVGGGWGVELNIHIGCHRVLRHIMINDHADEEKSTMGQLTNRPIKNQVF